MTLEDAVALIEVYELNLAQLDVLRGLLLVLKNATPPDLDLFPVFLHLFTDSMCFEFCTSEDHMSHELYSSDLLTRVQDLFVAKCLIYEHTTQGHHEDL
jgi:hypothetical protein